MKLINKDILEEYGFIKDDEKSKDGLTIMTRDKIDIVLKSDGMVWYSNMGIDYPLKDLAALRKLYKELRNKELNP